MAVFMINICKYNGCGITFPRLADLIEHIEDVHIDYDPAVVEQKEASQPSCIPLSYVLKFFTEASRREIQNMPPVAEVRRRLLSAPKTPSVRSSTPTVNPYPGIYRSVGTAQERPAPPPPRKCPSVALCKYIRRITGSDMDEDEMLSPSEDSNDSWTTVEEYSSEYILRYGVNRLGAAAAVGPILQDKPFACPVPGCKKRYKNVNGIKYHSKNGHKKDGKVKKGYKCQCGKSYKTAQGLKNHSAAQHASVARAAAAGAGLVVTAAPARLAHDPDPGKLVRIYDAIKAKDLQTFTIPKHNLASVNIVNGVVRALAPGKFERAPKIAVARPLAPLAPYAQVGSGANA